MRGSVAFSGRLMMVAVAIVAASACVMQPGGIKANATGSSASLEPLQPRVLKDDSIRHALAMKCVLLDAHGTVVQQDDCENSLGPVPPGHYTLQVEGTCQPRSPGVPVTVTSGLVTEASGVQLPLPKPERLYLAKERTLEEFPAAVTNRAHQITHGGQVLDLSIGPYSTFPPNTAVDLVRKWPGKDGRSCTNALVRIVDAGGPVLGGDSHAGSASGASGFRERRRDVIGKVYVVPIEDLIPTANGAPAVERVAAREEAAKVDAAAQAERQTAEDEQEAKSGRCSDAHAGVMQNLIANVGQIFDSRGGSGEQFRMLDKKILLATKDGTAFNIDAATGGELHVFAVGFKAVKLEVRDGSGYPVADASMWAVIPEGVAGKHVESKLVRTNLNEKLPAKLSGSGCTAVITMKKL